MDPIAYWVGLAVAAFGGGFAKDFFKWIGEKRAGIVAARRDEVSRAIAERDKAITERDTARRERNDAKDEIAWWNIWERILDEAFRLHRKRMIDAGLSVDPYPDKPAKSW